MKCTTVLHVGVCHRISTPRKSGNNMKEKKKTKSVVHVDDLTSGSYLNPPATTIYWSTGACERNSSDKECAIYALLSANDRVQPVLW